MDGRLLLGWVASSACLLKNPDFGVDDATTTAATTAVTTAAASGSAGASTAPGTGGATTGAGSDAGSASDAGTTAATAATSTSAETGVDSSGAAATGGDTTSTTGAPPGEYALQPTVAACVMLPADNAPFAGPAVCSANATAQNGTALSGLIMIDTSVVNLDGAGRPAHSYLRFDVPENFGGATIVSATLRVQVADGPDDLPNGPQSGVLVRTEAFDAATLAASWPQTIETLAGDQGFVATDQIVTWSIDTALVQPGQPLLLGLLPTDTDGVFYRGATTPGAPVLTVVLQ